MSVNHFHQQNAAGQDLENLIAILQFAYSGELAAALAYNGHWHSARRSEERSHIQQIENEEWHHRKLVGEMLAEMGRLPRRSRELRAGLIGRILAILCHLIGWFAPMYAAGRLESRNIREYEVAARFALKSGHPEFVDCLLTMAEVEWEHEKYFRSQVMSHRFSRKLSLWPSPPEKEEIRKSFQAESNLPYC